MDGAGLGVADPGITQRHRSVKYPLVNETAFRRSHDQGRSLAASPQHRLPSSQVEAAHLNRFAMALKAVMIQNGENVFF